MIVQSQDMSDLYHRSYRRLDDPKRGCREPSRLPHGTGNGHSVVFSEANQPLPCLLTLGHRSRLTRLDDDLDIHRQSFK